MKLIFLRHTTATNIAPRDAVRALTSDGEWEAQIAGAGLAVLGIRPAMIFSSPLVRARQTAEIAAVKLSFPGAISELTELANDYTTAELLHSLQPYRDASEILLVGHMPSIAEHVSQLIGAAFVEGFGKGSAALVELPELRLGAGKLVWRKSLADLVELA